MSEQDFNLTPPGTVEVTILNRTLRLRSENSREHVEQVARLVDERMRLISSRITTHDVAKIAILAALNIADEMQSLRDHYENEIQPLLSKYSDTQGGAVSEGGDRGEPGPAEPQSWFEDFFNAPVETKSRAERLSSQISAKLQALRPNSSEQVRITPEEDDS
ncbi:MAG TPA: cell division protein ZapA [Pyrinomonadaceae bacterium]|nr:cell division protein ZapA [Pyrinomonadaceae bacterium]